MTLTQEQLSKKLIGLKLQLPKRYHDSIRELIDTDAALRARLEAVERDYEAAQHLADTTGGAWKLCKHDVDVAREQLAKVERERDRWMEDKPLSGVIVKLEERLAAAEGRVQDNNDLVHILSNHCGESGVSEGAVKTLNRIIAERDRLVGRVQEVEDILRKAMP